MSSDVSPNQNPNQNPSPEPVAGPSRGSGGAWPGGRTVAAIALTALAVLLIVHYAGGSDRDQGRVGADHTPSLAFAGQREARLVVSGGTDRLTVTAADLGGDLVRAQRAVPVLRQSGTGSVSVSTAESGETGGGGADLTVRLARDVRWEIAIDGGTGLLTLDLDSGLVRDVDVSQGVSTVEAALPRPDGVLRARIGGGANAVRVAVPAGVPAVATFSGGAGGARLDGVEHDGLGGGEILTAPADAQEDAADRIDLALDSGIGRLELTHAG